MTWAESGIPDNRWSSLQDINRVAAILSNEAEHRDTERAVDSAIKRMLTQIEDARVLAGSPKFGGFDEEGSALSSRSEEEDLDEELIKMGEEVVGLDSSDLDQESI